MVIVDTTVWIDFLGGAENEHVLWLERAIGRQRLGLTDLILCEVLQGTKSEVEFAQLRKELLKFAVFNGGGAAICVAAAQNCQKMRRRGYTVRKTIDCLIGTFCLRNGHTLLHRDRGFDVFERELGLSVVHP